MSLSNTSHWVNQKEIQYQIADIRKYPVMSKEVETETIQRIKNGDDKAKELLVLSNLRFVVTVAKRYQNQGLSLPDLISEGYVGLVKASHRFDYHGLKLKPGQEQIKFLTYAVWWIRQSILEALAITSRLIRLPANYISDVYKSNKEPMAETVHDYSLQFPRLISFDASIDDTGSTLHELLKDEMYKSPDDSLDNAGVNIKASLYKIISFLSSSERFVLIRLFGMDNDETWTLQEIAEHMGLTKERVRQIKEKSLQRLRANSLHLKELLD